MTKDFSKYAPGYDIPALPGMRLEEVQTPALIIDLDAFDHNLVKMRDEITHYGVRHRAHCKMHKSADIAQLQINSGGACGVCCQKVSEAEALARAGIADILVSNEVCDPNKIDRLAQLPKLGARILVCTDDLSNIAELSRAAARHNTELEVLVELDCGGGRCGVTDSAAALELAQAILTTPHLRFAGLQSYQGSAQHAYEYAQRKALLDTAITITKDAVDLLASHDITCEIVGGAGTGSYPFEAASGVFNELQCGSYLFMDADYRKVKTKEGAHLPAFKHALFLLTSIMSIDIDGQAVCDAGLKAHSIDSGLPTVLDRPDLQSLVFSDEHGVLKDRANSLKLNDRLLLIPGHCDPTCNLHDWYVGLRNGFVETLWPVTARGKFY
ncbi:3-hydroxy-D-aspartate aldolase [Pseudovibrio axinellae]|uniref:3-hydroxy-D-aspartate aldolase n=1 Tax=Pseudovibrio axinellae TaxID=989403 RepID=A0A165XP89_9HYPH|nr:DSD1 family PLP-dependent enzyme [Pseudovibrio axinellae]KZL17910.1 3-hydroxy-D-aspartate aldolase [Pseudovibrio axinellae]SER58121.1 D-3-hydroxyaspartate aldolase [Pseudovibrio axinellae]